MIPAVLDTNVLASGFIRLRHPASTPDRLLGIVLDRAYPLVVSEHILSELTRVFAQPYFLRFLDPGQAETNIALLRQVAQVVAPAPGIQGVASHGEDDAVLATAVRVQPSLLVTEDSKLRQIQRYQDVTLLSGRDFLAYLAAR